jgi:hypothetical protein
MKKIALNFVFLLISISSQAIEELAMETPIRKILELRLAVEKNSGRYEARQKIRAKDLEALELRRIELEQALSKERFREEVADSKKLGLQGLMNEANETPEQTVKRRADQARIKSWILELESWINAGIPFKKESRLADLEKVRLKLQENEPSEILVQDLWALTEKEIKLTSSSRHELMKIRLEDEVPAQVARIGLMQMYFKTAKNQFGYAEKIDNKWILSVKSNPDEIRAIERILTQLKSEKNGAYLELPGFNLEVQP